MTNVHLAVLLSAALPMQSFLKPSRNSVWNLLLPKTFLEPSLQPSFRTFRFYTSWNLVGIFEPAQNFLKKLTTGGAGTTLMEFQLPWPRPFFCLSTRRFKQAVFFLRHLWGAIPPRCRTYVYYTKWTSLQVRRTDTDLNAVLRPWEKNQWFCAQLHSMHTESEHLRPDGES